MALAEFAAADSKTMGPREVIVEEMDDSPDSTPARYYVANKNATAQQLFI